ncbi:MAG TPA: S8 family serine peptidase [Gaiellaceae bacterium]
MKQKVRAPRRAYALLAVAVTAMAALAFVSAAGASNRPVQLPDGAIDGFRAATLPLGSAATPVTVMVQLKGDPVTVADADSASGLSQGQKDQLQGQLKSQQGSVAQQIQSLGGTILGSYQLAYNGIKVQIPANKISSLYSLNGVTAVNAMKPMSFSNIHGVPLIGAPAVWDGLAGLHGEGIKVGIIDTGIDYTHADFGGTGRTVDYQTALAADTLPANPAWFGPNAPRIKGGIDLVGDKYNADSKVAADTVPHPDPNPLDCNEHGTHVAGTVGGSGVLADGSTYTGPYNASTIGGHDWNVGPGVAPKVDLYAIRVFGCAGSTNVVVDAIEWAVANHMDVINMSLGAPFGTADTPDAVAATNAAKDGTIVIASAGNNGTNGNGAYITGSPASGTGVLSIAATDPTQALPGAALTPIAKTVATQSSTVNAIVANGFSPLPGTPLNVRVIWGNAAHTVISLGCSVAADTADGPIAANTVIVVARGTCARVAKAIFGQQAGAAAVIMVNNSSALPPFEGKITSNPDDGVPYNVTIPFLGVSGGSTPSTSTTGKRFIASNGTAITMTALGITNPGYLGIASFSSPGPAAGGLLKPNVTAPGVSIISAGMGTGTEAFILSGTSMSAPHTTGMAALVRQAHPTWQKVRYWDAAIENTAAASMINGGFAAGSGNGLIQAPPAVATNVVALGTSQTPTLDFGYRELRNDFSDTRSITLRNFGSTAATFAVSAGRDSGSPHSVSVPGSVTVPAGGEATVDVGLSVPVATAGGGTIPFAQAFHDVAGAITFTPAAGSNNGVGLSVPYYLVPNALSNVHTSISTGQLKSGSAAATITNNGAVAGNADWYAWQISDPKERGLGANDVTSVGVQTFPGAKQLAFAISTSQTWTNGATQEFDVLVDKNGDGAPDYDVVAGDFGAITTGTFNGEDVVAVFPIDKDGNFGPGSIRYLTDAPTDSSTVVLPVDFDQIGIADAATATFTYAVNAFNITDGSADSTSTATFNAFSAPVNTGMFDSLNPGATATETLTVNAAQQALTPALGWLVVSHDNAGGADEAQTIGLR